MSWPSGTVPPEPAQNVDAGAEHTGCHGGQQPGIGIPVRIGAEPLGEPFGHGPLDHRHLRRVGRAQVRVGTGLLHPAQPVRRVAAELTELIGDRLGVADHDHAQYIQDGLAGRLVHDALAQRRDPVRVRAEQRGFLGREVVEERARRHVRRLGDVLHGDVREAALGDQVERYPAQRPAGRQLLPLAQRGARLAAGGGGFQGHRALTKLCMSYKFALQAMLHDVQQKPCGGCSRGPLSCPPCTPGICSPVPLEAASSGNCVPRILHVYPNQVIHPIGGI